MAGQQPAGLIWMRTWQVVVDVILGINKHDTQTNTQKILQKSTRNKSLSNHIPSIKPNHHIQSFKSVINHGKCGGFCIQINGIKRKQVGKTS